MSEYTQEQFFTPDQIKAIKRVESAMKAASKVGINFWDNYGTLAAYSINNISHPEVLQDKDKTEINTCDGVMIYSLKTKNFFPGNADDPLYSKIKKLNNV